MLTAVRFAGIYQFQLSSPSMPTRLSRPALETELDTISRTHGVDISLVFEASSVDTVNFTRHTGLQPPNTPVRSSQSARVDMSDPPNSPESNTTNPADTALEAFLNRHGVRFDRMPASRD